MEDYVSKETAILLCEKGYDWPVKQVIKTINWYSDKFGEEAKDPKNWSTHEEILDFDKDCVSFEQPLDNGAVKICTITPLIHLYDAQKWLIQRGFIVLVDIDFTELSSFYCNVYNPSGLIALQTVYCDSYQKALEEGLKMTLKII